MDRAEKLLLLDITKAAANAASQSIVLKLDLLPNHLRMAGLALTLQLMAIKARSLGAVVPEARALMDLVDTAAAVDEQFLRDMLAAGMGGGPRG